MMMRMRMMILRMIRMNHRLPRCVEIGLFAVSWRVDYDKGAIVKSNMNARLERSSDRFIVFRCYRSISIIADMLPHGSYSESGEDGSTVEGWHVSGAWLFEAQRLPPSMNGHMNSCRT